MRPCVVIHENGNKKSEIITKMELMILFPIWNLGLVRIFNSGVLYICIGIMRTEIILCNNISTQ